MQFIDVIGQDAIKKRLIDSVKENRISHALLFSGFEGTGKLAMALAYAQYLNCKNPSDTDSCGECSSCKKYNKLIHPDLHFVFPVIKTKQFPEAVSNDFISKWREQVLKDPYFNINSWNDSLDVENSQASIFVHEGKEIIHKLNLKTFEADYKVMIIWMVERMNITCANKLLKILEEPPPRTLFILISESDEKLLSTIRSRTQLVKFTGIDQISMIKALEINPDADGKNLNGLAHLANGNYIYAKELLSSNEDADFNYEEFTKVMRLTFKRSWDEIFEWVEMIAGIGREKQKSFILYCLKMIRENFIFNFKQPEINYLNNKEKGFSERFSPFINERNIMVFSEVFEIAFRDISQNGNPKIIFLDMMLKITKIIKL